MNLTKRNLSTALCLVHLAAGAGMLVLGAPPAEPTAPALPPVTTAAAQGGEAAAGAPSIEEWKAKIAETLEDLRISSRLRDRMVMLRELAKLVEQPVEPRSRYVEELRSLIAVAPAGILLNTIVHSLVDEGSVQALETLFGVFDRKDFQTLDGRPVARGEIEMRHRIVEMNLMMLGDRLFARRIKHAAREPQRGSSEGEIVDIPSSQRKWLQQQLNSANERFVRSAAYVLGGTGEASAAGAIVKALGEHEDDWTRAILLEALGRTDPEPGRSAILQAAAGAEGAERLAALPVVGLLKGEDADAQLKEAMEDRSWFVRRAGVAACRNRRDTFAMDLLMGRFPEETARLQHDIYMALLDITGNVLPPDPKEWPRWWKIARRDFRAAPRGESLRDRGKTRVVRNQQYFGLELASDQLALLFDISSSMNSTNLALGLTGVGLEGASKSGSPLVLAKDQLSRLVKRFTRHTRFNFIAYNDRVRALGKKIVRASSRNVRKALRFVKKVRATGDTNTFGALVAALKDPEVDTIVLLSDGEPTRGLRTEPTDILEAVARYNRFRQTRIHTIQIGPSLELMRLLAEYSDGRYKNITTKANKDARP